MNEVFPESRTSLAAVFHGSGIPLELQQIPVPKPAAGEAIVRITCCTVCGSDLHTIAGKRIEPTPTIPGHEIIGTVVEIGEPAPVTVTGQLLQPGDRISWSVCVSCGTCDRCLQGLNQKCHTLQKYGHDVATGRLALSGGLAEFMLLRMNSAVAIVDPALSDAEACPANCATATVAAAMRLAGSVTGKRVRITGAGMLGLTAAAMSMFRGATHVEIRDPDLSRRSRASDFCPDAAVLEPDHEAADADVVFECSGAAAAIEKSFHSLAIGGTMVLIGSVLPGPPVSLDPERIIRRCLTIRGIHNYTPEDLQAALDFLIRSHDRFAFDQLVERTFPLADINAAVAWAMEQQPIRVGILPGAVS